MGEQHVSSISNQKQMQKFVKALLRDVRSMEYMLDNNWFENDVTRIGAEQEMVLVERETFKPAPIAMEVLEELEGCNWLDTELAKFNLEINLDPIEFRGDCFSQLHEQTAAKLNALQAILDKKNVDLVLTGILPTLRKYHLDLKYLTPKKRYKAILDAIKDQLIGQNFELKLEGLDELNIKHDSPLLEACNTSFQVHLQVSSDDFVKKYNIAQALTAPVMAIAANSPIVFGKRLWHESRIAMFQQAIDTRSSTEHMRERSARVSFGKDWLHDSILDIYREDISRFRVLLSSDVNEDSKLMIKNGQTPHLKSLQVHNSTIYRWNRPCYGISPNGKPHLRIECRVIPAGPTVNDEVANACFWLGLVEGMALRVDDIRDHIAFDDVRDNFMKAAKFGIDSKFTWFNDTKVSAKDLILNELLPIAEEGLKSKNIAQSDIDKYLGTIRDRTSKHMNGARWLLRGYTHLKKDRSNDEALSMLTATMVRNQISGKSVHDWELPTPEIIENYKPSHLKVSEFMQTDILTVQQNDIIDLVAEMMDWKNISYTPVEDSKGKLVGLVSSRILLRYLLKHKMSKKDILVKKIMIKDPITIGPDTSISTCLKVLRENDLSCLPVVQNGELIGMVILKDFLKIVGSIIERLQK